MISCGKDDSEVVPVGTTSESKSMGHSMTFKRDTKDKQALNKYILELCDKAARRLRRASLSARCVRLVIRYKSFTTFTRQSTLTTPTDDTKLIYKTACSILSCVDLKEPVRLIGVSLSQLVAYSGTISLFDSANKKYKINRILDAINDRFGEQALCFASLLDEKAYERVISPAWRPHGSKKY
jgi:DNA polymerase-4